MTRWIVLLAVFLATHSHAATLIVTSTADTAGSTCGSVCTLRQAITAANATTAADTINFAITVPVRGELLIQPASNLPAIIQPLTINGYSQSGTRANTSESASDALLRIRIDGGAAGSTAGLGLQVCASETTIRGLSITHFPRFTSRAIVVSENCPNGATGLTNVSIFGNFIGVTGSGTAAGDINGVGVLVVGSVVRVGQTLADRNVISNSLVGVEFRAGGFQQKFVQLNLIGTDKTGTQDMGNAKGVLTSNSARLVLINQNLIRFNGVGVHIESGDAHAITGNRIFDNDGLGIDLGPLGVTPNDPGDGDTGPNGLRNFPTISGSRISTPFAGLSVGGNLDGPNTGNTLFRFDFFASTTCDPSGHGEGERYLGTLETTRGPGGGFNGRVETDDPLPPGTLITATARMANATVADTSEFSACFPLDPPALVVNSANDLNDGTCDAAHCSLREAMLAANTFSGGGLQFINFAIPPLTGTSEIVITPTSPLPAISRQYRIDGYSQPGAVANTDPIASNAVPRIRIQGSAAAPVGFRACLSATISGLALTNFNDAISTTLGGCPETSPGVIATGNFFGLRTDGSSLAANQRGVVIGDGQFAGVSRIGGDSPAERNVFAGGSVGVLIDSAATSITASSSIRGNLFGTDRSGSQNRSITRAVVLNNATEEVLIGSTDAPNLFRFNGTAIEHTGTGRANGYADNRFLNQTGIAIDLGADGVDLNDVGDIDSGPNGRQNYPVLSLVERNAEGARIIGSVDVPGTPTAGSLTVTFYASASCDASGNGEGEHVLTRVETGETFDLIVTTDVDLTLNPFVTAIATHTDGSSEFSACLEVTEPEVGIAVDSALDSLTVDGGCEIVADANLCTLREAILLANAQSGPDRIRFQIAGAIGPRTITPEALLPTITGGLTIDGYTQAGASPNAASEGFDAIIRIGIRPVSLAHAFRICTSEQVDIIGLAFTAGVGPIIDLKDNDAGDCALFGHTRVLGNQFGITADGATSSVSSAVSANGSRLTLGGPNAADRNMVTRSTINAVLLAGPLASGSIIQNTLFGRDGDLQNAPNASDVRINSASNVIVGGEGLLANDFANSSTAISVTGTNADRNTLYANRFRNHSAATAIDLGDDGISVNDANDVDSGANDGQNTPVLQGVTGNAGAITISGVLDVPIGIVTPTNYRLAFYRSSSCNDQSGSGNGREGQDYLGSQLRPFTSIAETFSATVNAQVESGFITATATAPDGSTSEFSNCLAAPRLPDVFADGFE